MDTTDAFRGLRDRRTGHVHGTSDPTELPTACDRSDPSYEYGSVDPTTLFTTRDPVPSPSEQLEPTPGMWRFDSLLPFPAATAITASEGSTPLVRTDRLAEELGVSSVYVKDEGRNPTGSVLDRGFSLAVTAVAQRVADGADVEPLVCASPGNGGTSMAAYAGRADIRSYAFVPSRSGFANKSMTNVHGGEMRVVGGRYPDAVAAVDEQLETTYTSLDAFTTPYRHEGIKTVAFELVADLGVAPDVVVVPTGSGEVLAGMYKGFRELERIAAIDECPRLIAAQPAGCAPIAAAIQRGLDRPEPWSSPDTICGELEIPDPAGGDIAIAAVRESGGDSVSVSDDDILESAVAVAQNEVLEMGVSGGVAPAGAWVAAERGLLDDGDTVVLCNTEAGLKTPDVLRSHLMGKGI